VKQDIFAQFLQMASTITNAEYVDENAPLDESIVELQKPVDILSKRTVKQQEEDDDLAEFYRQQIAKKKKKMAQEIAEAEGNEAKKEGIVRERNAEIKTLEEKVKKVARGDMIENRWMGWNYVGMIDTIGSKVTLKDCIVWLMKRMKTELAKENRIDGYKSMLKIEIGRSSQEKVQVSTKMQDTWSLLNPNLEAVQKILDLEANYNMSLPPLMSIHFGWYVAPKIKRKMGAGIVDGMIFENKKIENLVKKHMYSSDNYCSLASLFYLGLKRKSDQVNRDSPQDEDELDATVESMLADNKYLLLRQRILKDGIEFGEIGEMARELEWSGVHIYDVNCRWLYTSEHMKGGRENAYADLFYHEGHYMACRIGKDTYNDMVQKILKDSGEVIEMCGICLRKTYGKVIHKHGKLECYNCNEHVCKNINHNDLYSDCVGPNHGHECYIESVPYVTKETKYYAYDVECYHQNGEQIPYIVGMVEIRLNEEIGAPTCLSWQAFLDLLVTMKGKDCVFFAHNGRFYDSYLVTMDMIFEKREIPRYMIKNGQKIMASTFGKLRLVDSLNHFAGKLDDLPKMFDLSSEVKKGNFPHDFFTEENRKYVGPIPDKKYFPTYMKMKEKVAEDLKCGRNPAELLSKISEFDEWHNQYGGIEYNIAEECLLYCLDDVKILALALQKYATVSIKETSVNKEGLNPLDYVTTASYCMAVYKNCFMLPKTIAFIIPKQYERIKKGFFGGRTEVMRVYYESGVSGLFGWGFDNTVSCEATYIDQNSMYPARMIQPLPTGQPKFYNSYDPEKLLSQGGFAEVDITPPTDLHIPVLGCYRGEPKKLIFALDPIYKQTYPIPELRLAVSKGYVITKVHSCVLMDENVSPFQTYVQYYYEKKSGVNPGEKARRTIYKNMLNNLWGKYAYDPLKRQVAVISKEGDYQKRLSDFDDGKIEINDIVTSNTHIILSYDWKELKPRMLANTNIAIAAYITSYARCNLYENMDKLEKFKPGSVMYCDTDSIIAACTVDEMKLAGIDISDKLGAWKVEESGITKFVGLGPKTYAYTAGGKQTVKSKGFSVGFSVEEYQQLVDDKSAWLEEKLLHFSREKMESIDKPIIRTNYIVKKLQNKFDKRVVIENGNTVPFGFCKK